MTQTQPAKYLTLEETAQLMRLSTETLYQWRSRGFGPPAAKVGGRVIFDRDTVERWIEAQTS